MEFGAINSASTAFLAGLVTSLHCVGMCGPLACSLMPVRGDRADPATIGTAYQVSRLASYALLGALAGGLGASPLSWLTGSALRWTPWLFVLFFVALAFRWDRFLPKPVLLSRWSLRLHGWVRRQSRVRAAVAIGLATPVLPCGPLYFVLAVALMAGSAVRGVEFMLAFGIGTIPLLWLAQSRFAWVRQRLSPLWLARTRVALALVTAVMIGWRLRATLGFPGPDPSTFVCH